MYENGREREREVDHYFDLNAFLVHVIVLLHINQFFPKQNNVCPMFAYIAYHMLIAIVRLWRFITPDSHSPQ